MEITKMNPEVAFVLGREVVDPTCITLLALGPGNGINFLEHNVLI